MKKLRKVFAVLLTLAMVLGLSMTTFAANLANGSFTVSGLKTGAKVSYAQILQQNDTTSAWELTENAIKANLTWKGENGEADFAVTADNLGNKNANDLEKLQGLGSLAYGNEKSETNGSVTFDNLPAGLYAVKALDETNEYVYSFMIAKVEYVNGVLRGSDLTAKGEKSVPTKTASTNSVVPGEVVTFTVKVPYPKFMTGSTNRTMHIVDTVENGTIIENTVAIGNDFKDMFTTSVTEGKTLTIDLIADKYEVGKAGQEVTITYDVRANAGIYNAVTNTVVNTVPGSDGQNHSGQAIVKLPNTSAEITKVDATSGETITTSSATFVLYKEVANDYVAKEGEEVVDVKVFVPGVSGAANTEKTIKALQVGDSINTTGGKVTFTGLEPDPDKATYYVKETVAPNGYSVEPLARKLSGTDVVLKDSTPAKDQTSGIYTVTTEYEVSGTMALEGFTGLNFNDTSLSSLPSTGGIGTTIFTIGGCAIMVIAAALFFASRRKSAK